MFSCTHTARCACNWSAWLEVAGREDTASDWVKDLLLCPRSWAAEQLEFLGSLCPLLESQVVRHSPTYSTSIDLVRAFRFGNDISVLTYCSDVTIVH